MLDVFIGTEPAQARADKALEASLLHYASGPVNIHWMRNGEGDFEGWANHGATGFTMFRFAVPELCGFEGTAVYLDCDMLLLDDVYKLARLGRPGRWITAAGPDGDCVSVIDCASVKSMPTWPCMRTLRAGRLRKWHVRNYMGSIVDRHIPEWWNSTDQLTDATRLLHFSNLKTQPWQPSPSIEYESHADPAAASLWDWWEKHADCHRSHA